MNKPTLDSKPAGQTEVQPAAPADDESLRLSEERYRTLVLASAATVWITDPDGGFCAPQQSWQVYTGQPWEQQKGWGWSKMLHPHDADRMLSDWRGALERRQPLMTEGRVWNAACGEYRHCELRGVPIMNADGTVREWVGTTTDVHQRLLVNKALREGEMRLAEAQRIANIGSFEVDLTSDIDTWSHEFYRILGYDPQTTKPCFDNFLARVHPQDRSTIVSVNRRLSRGAPVTYEFRALLPDGTCKHISDHVELVCDETGRPTRLIGTAQDITEQKAAEDALRSSEAKYADLYDNAPDMFCSIDVSTARIDRCNQTLASNLGYQKEELLGRSVLDLYDPSCHDQVQLALALFLETGYLRDREFQLKRRDGSKIDVSLSVSAVRDAEGTITQSRSILRDITKRKQAEDALRESTHRLRSILDNVLAMVGLFELDGTVIDVNQASLSMAGLRREDVLGRHLADTYWFNYDSSEQATVRNYIDRASLGEVVQGEVHPKTSSGETIDAYSWFNPLRDSSGRVVQVIGSGFDITERNRAAVALRESEENLRQLNLELEQRVAARTSELESKNSELEAFAHSVSHDLRAPLRGMEGFAVALQEDYEEQLDEAARQYVQHIIVSAKRMDNLINDLLAYSQLSRDQLSLKPVSLQAVAQTALEQLRDEIRIHDAEVIIDGELPTVLGHRSTLGQIVTNLVSNAIKFTADGVRPTVRLSSEVNGPIARLWVTDNGIGISPQYQDQIFHVFERLHGIETFPGTGIGLAIVSRAAERMAGRYGVESAPGAGSRFWVEFPIQCRGD